MKGYSHLAIGTFTVITFSLRVAPLWRDFNSAILSLIVAAVGSLLPDIDSDESLIRRSTGTNRSSGWGGRIISWLISIPSGGHRVAFHSPLVLLALSWIALIYFRGNLPAVAFAMGYGLHLLADALTVEGIPWLWPFTRRRFGLPLIRTGGVGEYFFMVAFGVASVLLWKS